MDSGVCTDIQIRSPTKVINSYILLIHFFYPVLITHIQMSSLQTIYAPYSQCITSPLDDKSERQIHLKTQLPLEMQNILMEHNYVKSFCTC